MRIQFDSHQQYQLDAILDDPDFNKPYIEVKSVKATKTKITAKLVIDQDLKPLPVDDVHNGYFAKSSKGEAKDTRGNTKADDVAYELIMQDKERLLSRDEPLRFIFSHSALREGWDNPNVFQICTLNETTSEIKKRQEIGRGLRLPVRENGLRCFDGSSCDEHYWRKIRLDFRHVAAFSTMLTSFSGKSGMAMKGLSFAGIFSGTS